MFDWKRVGRGGDLLGYGNVYFGWGGGFSCVYIVENSLNCVFIVGIFYWI